MCNASEVNNGLRTICCWRKIKIRDVFQWENHGILLVWDEKNWIKNFHSFFSTYYSSIKMQNSILKTYTVLIFSSRKQELLKYFSIFYLLSIFFFQLWSNIANMSYIQLLLIIFLIISDSFSWFFSIFSDFFKKFF